MLMVNLITLLGVFMGLVKFILNDKSVLISLLSLEYISLLMYLLISTSLPLMGGEMYYLLYFLVMMICEGVLGLSLMILASFSYSGSSMKLYNSTSC
uniref:NADH dehydrogenase subunit 4L n=1 Tax=Metacrangonyx remyi TaxID=931576 RepID=K7ZW41_9CRUS|nr:NADH dehydrogenase subunit 4L [Metacrangonyx remyi]CCI69568.1 NADH dehydrogenase subunit 4L [Metacrangonyx remyi]